MATLETEDSYLIAEGSDGELYVFLTAKSHYPQNPRIIYDGKDHAVFVRAPEQKIILDYINPEIRDKLRKAEQITVVEAILEKITNTYHVDMQHVDNIPLDWSKIGLKTWEEAALNS